MESNTIKICWYFLYFLSFKIMAQEYEGAALYKYEYKINFSEMSRSHYGILLSEHSCPSGYDDTVGSKLFWPTTPVGKIAKQACPEGAQGNVTRACVWSDDDVPEVTWNDASVVLCKNQDFLELSKSVRF